MKLREKHGGREVNDLCFSFPPFAQKLAKHFEPIRGFKQMIFAQAVLGACFDVIRAQRRKNDRQHVSALGPV